MGVFHVFYIVQMLANRATHHNCETKLDCLLSGAQFYINLTKNHTDLTGTAKRRYNSLYVKEDIPSVFINSQLN